MFFMLLKVKWERINDILHFGDINVYHTFINKILNAHVCWNLFGEMTFVDLKSFVSITSIRKLHT